MAGRGPAFHNVEPQWKTEMMELRKLQQEQAHCLVDGVHASLAQLRVLLERRLEEIDARLNAMDGRLEALEALRDDAFFV